MTTRIGDVCTLHKGEGTSTPKKGHNNNNNNFLLVCTVLCVIRIFFEEKFILMKSNQTNPNKTN